MLQDILLTPEEIALKQEVRAFTKREVSSDLIAWRLPPSTPRGR
jgi:hypothetical protein